MHTEWQQQQQITKAASKTKVEQSKLPKDMELESNRVLLCDTEMYDLFVTHQKSRSFFGANGF